MPKIKGLKRLGRVDRLRSLQALPDLADRKKRKEKAKVPGITLPDQPAGNDKEQEIAREYGDSRLAGRVMELMRQYPAGSVPELVVFDFLRWRNIRFDYQVALFGGWGRAGGIVPDFILKGTYAGEVLQVQGDYWHATARKRGQDTAAKVRLLGTVWNGQPITKVTNVWESNLKNPSTRQRTLDLALGGIELPGS